jgi:uncharacterized Tic20 family protein
MYKTIITARGITATSHLLTRPLCIVDLLGGCEYWPKNVVWLLKMKHEQLSETHLQLVEFEVSHSYPAILLLILILVTSNNVISSSHQCSFLYIAFP